jgi:toxoflavin synthase
VDYVFFLDNESFAITNYHLSVATHELAFRTARFKQIRWHDPKLLTDIVNDTERQYWSDFREHSPIVFIERVK